MMPLKIITLSAALLVPIQTLTASAQSSGEITVTLGGEEQVLPLWAVQSDWSGSESWPSVSIYARGTPDDGSGPMVMSLGFEASGWMPQSPELELSRYRDGERVLQLFAHEEDERGALSVTLDTHSVDGQLLTLSGSFQGTMGPSENRGRDIDLADGVAVTGGFLVTLEQLD